MAVTIKILLTAVVFCSVTRIATADQCQYIECVLEGVQSRETEVDVYMSNFNNSQFGNDVTQRCAALNERIARCEAKETNCPTTLTKPWNERMLDPYYVKYLMSLAKNFCKNPLELSEIGKCFNDELQTAVKSCVREGTNFNASCLKDQYRAFEKCPNSVDKLFALIVDAFVASNPHLATSTQTPPPPTNSAGQCQYIDCVLEGAPRSNSEVEMYLNLFVTQQGGDVAERCAVLNERAVRCEAKRDNCPTSLSEPWSDRMKDSFFVKFLIDLGKEFCKSSQELNDLSKCFTSELREAVKGCVTGGLNFNLKCIQEQYTRLGKCSDSDNNIFFSMIHMFLSGSPYQARSSPTPPRINTKGQCEYVDCILEGAPRSSTEVEMYLAFFVGQQNDDPTARCSVLAERVKRCEQKTFNCPSTIIKPWNERLTDPIYMKFLMSLAGDFCKNPQQLKDFRNCFTREIHTAVQTCVRDGPNFSASCIQDQYTRLEKCPLSTDEFFFAIIQKFLARNPYRGPSVKATSSSVQVTSSSIQVTPRVEPKDQCEYLKCAYDGAPRVSSEVEMYLSHFLNQQVSDVAARCTALTERAARCQVNNTNCPTALTKPWDERMQDPIYVDFLVTLGRYFCKNPQQLKEIGDCFNNELHTSIQTCVPEGHNFNVTCVFDQYKMLEQCPESTDAFFSDIVNFFLKLNPYWNKGEDKTSRRERMHELLGLNFL